MLCVVLGSCAEPDQLLDIPQDRRDPVNVVQLWVDAVNAGDEARGQTLVASNRWTGLQGWFQPSSRNGRTPRLDDLKIVEVNTAPQTEGTAAQGYRFAAAVSVTFNVTDADETMPDGRTTWGYILAREDEGAPWMIVGNGM
jgi:hypothetical protein